MLSMNVTGICIAVSVTLYDEVYSEVLYICTTIQKFGISIIIKQKKKFILLSNNDTLN